MGCYGVSIPGKDGQPPMRAIICGIRKAKSKPCWVQHCGAPNTKLCDWPIAEGKTCDAPICDKHSTSVGPDRDVCPLHAIEGGWK